MSNPYEISAEQLNTLRAEVASLRSEKETHADYSLQEWRDDQPAQAKGMDYHDWLEAIFVAQAEGNLPVAPASTGELPATFGDYAVHVTHRSWFEDPDVADAQRDPRELDDSKTWARAVRTEMARRFPGIQTEAPETLTVPAATMAGMPGRITGPDAAVRRTVCNELHEIQYMGLADLMHPPLAAAAGPEVKPVTPVAGNESFVALYVERNDDDFDRVGIFDNRDPWTDERGKTVADHCEQSMKAEGYEVRRLTGPDTQGFPDVYSPGISADEELSGVAAGM